MQMEARETPSRREKPKGALGFGRVFTDHMFRMDYDEASGWHDGAVEPYAPLTIDPAAASLHYGQSVFEGMKAFLGKDGAVRIFRPERHAARFRQSCEKLCIPPVPEARFLEAVEAVVQKDLDWVPTEEGSALYIRPLVIATEAFLGVRPATRYTFLIILSPVGAYYAKGFSPVRIWVERKAVRAAKGGVGAAKTAANYAASLHAATAAKARGYDQVLWTDGAEHRWLEEVGTMNLFVHLGDEVVTPPLDGGTILAGVTRDSVITILRDRGVKVSERPISVEDLRAAHDAGTLHEVFGTGSAAVISPVGVLGFEAHGGLPGAELTIGTGETGPLAKSLFDAIVSIQRGEAADPHGWMRSLPHAGA